jgi:NADH-quinone oxidoreductase subunit N
MNITSFAGLLAQAKPDFFLGGADFAAIAPVVALAIGALVVLTLDLALPRNDGSRMLLRTVTFATLIVGMFLSAGQWGTAWVQDVPKANEWAAPLVETWRLSNFTVTAALLVQGITLLVLLLCDNCSNEQDKVHFGESHFLMLLFPLGIMIMTSATNLILAIIGLEIFSVALYILVGVRRKEIRAVEAAMKYFLLGAFGAGVFLYGAALIYAGSSSGLMIQVSELGQSARLQAPEGIAAVGGGLLFAALFFKASVVPFQMWTPDVYEGAPTPITALMSTGTKAGAFLLMISTLHLFPHEAHILLPIVTIATIVIGNGGAIVQTNLKRLLAYSGIAHAGYLMVALSTMASSQDVGATDRGTRAILFYLVTYAITNIAAFGVLAWLERKEAKVLTLEGIKGLGRRNPIASAAIALAMFSLAGIPPTAGFWGKYLVFAAALQSGATLLAIIGILGSVIGLYYYLRIIVNIYFMEADDPTRIQGEGISAPISIGISSALILVIGFVPGLLLDFLVNPLQ